MNSADLDERIRRAVLDGEVDEAGLAAADGLEIGVDPAHLLDLYIGAVREVGRLWEAGEYFLPEMVAGAEAVIAALAVIRPALTADGAALGGRRAVIGTVAGDMHDIGKSLVGNLLTARGFHVIDLGVDVAAQVFIDAVIEHEASVLGMSALLTTTMTHQRDVIERLVDLGLRERVKVLVGGAPVTESWAREIGADGTAADAMAAAELAWTLTEPR